MQVTTSTLSLDVSESQVASSSTYQVDSRMDLSCVEIGIVVIMYKIRYINPRDLETLCLLLHDKRQQETAQPRNMQESTCSPPPTVQLALARVIVGSQGGTTSDPTKRSQ